MLTIRSPKVPNLTLVDMPGACARCVCAWLWKVLERCAARRQRGRRRAPQSTLNSRRVCTDVHSSGLSVAQETASLTHSRTHAAPRAGLTKIATDNQPASIVRELEEMSRAYIRPRNVIILAVSPANADIATSDAMRLVREFDPQGARAVCAMWQQRSSSKH
jgi:hypothetical protein